MGMVFLLGGCAETSSPPAALPLRDWSEDGVRGSQIQTPHYRILTTVHDPVLIRRLAMVLETAHAQYVATIPPASDRPSPPMDVVFFEKPEEWEAYTTRLTGKMAPVYLSVGSGGYTYGDKVVCWLFNEADLWSVVAHEGFHQYVARTLPLRLPPALEEGLATTFESVSVGEWQVTIDRRENPRRKRGLADAMAVKSLLPLDQFVRGHAGDVAGLEQVVREGFYGQSWALAKLLLENPKYRDGLRQLLIDLRDGRATPVVGHTDGESLYQPAAVQPLLMRYIGKDWAAFENDYVKFCTSIASANVGRD